MKTLICKYCLNEFTPRNKLQKSCGSKTCRQLYRKEYDSKRDYTSYNRKRQGYKEPLDLFKKKNEFSRNIEKYSDKIIDYDRSPTKKCYIGFAKAPLMPNDNGIGYKGVKIQSENRELIQCSSCARWYKVITSCHLNKCCGLTVDEYKEKFGFAKNVGLTSDVYSNYLAEELPKKMDGRMNWLNFHKMSGDKQKRLMKNLKKGREKAVARRGQPYNPMSSQNERGTCPEQLKVKLINFVNRFKRLPRANERREGFCAATYTYRYGSMNNVFKMYGLPQRARGRSTEYVFPDGMVFKKHREESYDGLYSIMLEKCPILKTY